MALGVLAHLAPHHERLGRLRQDGRPVDRVEEAELLGVDLDQAGLDPLQLVEVEGFQAVAYYEQGELGEEELVGADHLQVAQEAEIGQVMSLGAHRDTNRNK